MKGEGREHDAWVIEDIGGRAEFEDAHSLVMDFQDDPARILGAVFDGHNGSGVAEHAAGRFPILFRKFIESGMAPVMSLESAFAAVDKETAAMSSGAVAVAFYLDGGELAFANVGDAELLLVSRSDHLILSELHRLTNNAERMRIIEAGGMILGGYVTLPKGAGLQCTRSLGDHKFKDAGVIPAPFAGGRQLGPQDIWLVAACDGLWDVMKPVDVASLARKMTTARAVAEALHHEAVKVRATPDNLTAMVVRAKS